MKILFITNSREDYLPDSLFMGLRDLFGADCIDYPKKDILYKNCPDSLIKFVRGNAFTLYGLLDDLPVDRSSIINRLKQDEFDLVIFSSIWRQFRLLKQWFPLLRSDKTIFCDGEDRNEVFPFLGFWWRSFSRWFVPQVHHKSLYYKREWTFNSQFNLWHRILPDGLRKILPAHHNLRKISFGIPEKKILSDLPKKKKDFARHCVDVEVANALPACESSYVFRNEADYYSDLQASRFAITTKRFGWDCLRHYEIAANGCIPCFRDLHKKPQTCAPHHLKHRVNCIEYHSFEQLMQIVNNLSTVDELNLRKGALKWAKQHSCTQVAQDLIDSFSAN